MSVEKVTFSGLQPARQTRIKNVPKRSKNLPVIELKSIIEAKMSYNVVVSKSNKFPNGTQPTVINILQFSGAGLCPVLINGSQDSVRILSTYSSHKGFFALMTDRVTQTVRCDADN